MSDGVKRPPQRLTGSAHSAWTTYVAMVESKERHFAYLQVLETKHGSGGRRSLAEISHLEGLLNEHNVCVQAFSKSVKQLAASDAAAHSELLTLIGEFNRTLGSDDPH